MKEKGIVENEKLEVDEQLKKITQEMAEC